ncbi:MAG TPA: hypothetical protein VMQ86_02900 [Bryobacteraceae bacterium]|nr:hypothetical protein [Bryobacteraceae bacterium]
MEASILLRLTRVLDLTNKRLLRQAGVTREQLLGPGYAITREIGLRAWENGIEALLALSAAHLAERNPAVFLDNQRPLWKVSLTTVTNDEG